MYVLVNVFANPTKNAIISNSEFFKISRSFFFFQYVFNLKSQNKKVNHDILFFQNIGSSPVNNSLIIPFFWFVLKKFRNEASELEVVVIKNTLILSKGVTTNTSIYDIVNPYNVLL